MRTWCGGAGGRGLLGILAACLVAIMALLLGPALSAEAATITVDTAIDDLTPGDGSVSLREAIAAINAGSDGGDNDITAHRSGGYGTDDTIHFNLFVNLRSPCPKTINVGLSGSPSPGPLPA